MRFTPVPSPVRPADHMHVLAPLLTERYAPLRPNGHGLQSIYLTALEPAFAEALLTLLGPEVRALAAGANVRDRPFDASRAPGQGQTEWEEHLIGAIRTQSIEETQKTALILARRGQGLFKQRVRQVEVKCRITGVDRIEHLRASHCKPWRDSTDSERLDGENGIPLSKIHHAAFDSPLIGIDPNYRLHVSDRLLAIHDGPLLEALKRLHGGTIHLPDRVKDRPDRDRLALRFESFKSTA